MVLVWQITDNLPISPNFPPAQHFCYMAIYGGSKARLQARYLMVSFLPNFEIDVNRLQLVLHSQTTFLYWVGKRLQYKYFSHPNIKEKSGLGMQNYLATVISKLGKNDIIPCLQSRIRHVLSVLQSIVSASYARLSTGHKKYLSYQCLRVSLQMITTGDFHVIITLVSAKQVCKKLFNEIKPFRLRVHFSNVP